MLLNNRHGSVDSDSYRYGFNGMERDDEIKGSGNSYDFGARMYDNRIGRWLRTDAMEGKYSDQSPYNSSSNNPIFFIDPDGNDILPYRYRYNWGLFYTDWSYISFTDFEGDRFHKAQIKIQRKSTVFKKLIKRLENSENHFQFKSMDRTKKNKKNYDKQAYASALGWFDPTQKGTEENPYTINFKVDYVRKESYTGDESTIFEETFHAVQFDLYKQAGNLHLYTVIGAEIEAKLVKNIEGIKVNDYEKVDFIGKEAIFNKIKAGKELTKQEKSTLGRAIDLLEASIRSVYEVNMPEIKKEFFLKEDIFNLLESLYGTEITTKSEMIPENDDNDDKKDNEND
jgi:RHS repeat-associated protein